MSGQGFRRLQDQYNDPLLTALAVMLVVLLFVVGPLQAAGVVAAHQFGIAFVLVLVAAVFIVSGSGVALAAVLFAVALIVLSTVLRLRQPSVLDIYLDAAA
jgi:type IV secretory pathway TrbL component